jgi:CBS domain-containing protein
MGKAEVSAFFIKKKNQFSEGVYMNTIQEIMTMNPACCVPTDTLQEVARLMVIHDCGEIPVVDNMADKRVVGVITDRDICCRTVALGVNPLEMMVSECMTSPAITVFTETALEECFDLMEENQIRRVPVLDEDERCCGMVSIADISRHAQSQTAAEVIKYISQPSVRDPIYVS